MVKLRKFLTSLILVIVLTTTYIPGVHAETDPAVNPSSQAATTNEISFEVQTPWKSLVIDRIETDSGMYASLSLPDWSNTSEPGAPSLPYLTKVIGVPFGVELSVQASAGKSHKIQLPAKPAPSLEEVADWTQAPGFQGSSVLPDTATVRRENQQIYQDPAAYPGKLVEITGEAELRQQRVATLAVYPMQYQPGDNSLVVYETIQIEVKFSGAAAWETLEYAPDSHVYEEFFKQTLLNYEQARHWRSNSSADSSLDAASSSLLVTEQAEALWLPPGEAWRIGVRDAGFYHLSYTELANAGLPVTSLDPRRLQMYYRGSQVAIQVTGEADGKFDTGDRIIFYAEKIDSKYTQESIYWLVLGSSNGLRMTTRDGTPGAGTVPSFYTAKKHLETNTYYLSAVPESDDFERFLGIMLYAPSTPSNTSNFSLAAPYPGFGLLTISMMGYISHAISPDHHVRISLNGTLIGDALWDGLAWKTLTYIIPTGLLVAGNNTLTLTCPNDTGVGYDMVFIDWIRLEFPSGFTAEDNRLVFDYATPGTWKYQVNNFNSDAFLVYDISEKTAPVRILNVAAVPSGSTYSAVFQDSITGVKSYAVTVDPGLRTVANITKDTPTNLQSTGNGADYILLTHKDFMGAAQQLAAHRTSQGLRVKLVDVQDVYDEFGYGMAGAGAIREFLAYTYQNWASPAPSYVVLMGNGHYDPKDYTATGEESFIPPYLALVDPRIGETAADNRYVTVAGSDNMPDMMLGRITVNDITQANIVVNNILEYEQNQVTSDWIQRVMMVADNSDSAGDFVASSDDLLSRYLPDTYLAEKVYLEETHMTADSVRAAIIAGINSGKILVNYIGHAAYTQWASEPIFEDIDIPSLINDGKLPVILAMTCYEGYYQIPGLVTIAEAITRKEGSGAIASWSPSGAGVATGHDFLNRGFFRAFFQNGALTVGEATTYGKLLLWSSGSNLDLLDTFLLFGDPALVFQRPLTAVYDSYVADQDTSLAVTAVDGVLSNDINPDGLPLTAVLGTTTAYGTLSLSSNGAFTYTPNPGWYGRDTFTYRAYDGATYSNTATVNILVLKLNHAPTDITLSKSTIYENWPENTEVGLFSTTDQDTGDTFIYSLVDGTGSTDNTSFNIYQNKLRSSVRFDYEAKNALSIRVRTTDERGAYYEEVFIISVLDLNDAPVAVDDSFTTEMNQPLVLTGSQLTANDTDEDASNDVLSVLDVYDAVGGSVEMIEDVITFTPTVNYAGSASFDYTVSDGSLVGFGHVSITITSEIIWELVYLPAIFR